jgi:hypothetical protein
MIEGVGTSAGSFFWLEVIELDMIHCLGVEVHQQ